MSIPYRLTLMAAVAAALLPLPIKAQSTAALVQRLDSIAGSEVAGNRAVGMVVAVARGGETMLLKATGKADIDAGTPMTANTIVPVGSVTKQFTAVAILKLRDAGKLDLDDPLTKWLPEFGSRGDGLTLRHLLGHTAGGPEFPELPEIRAMQLLRNATVSRDSVYGIMSRYPFRFAPGAMQVYSNTGYWLLGRVVEKASGMTYEDYIQKELFAPLGMSRSMYCGNARQAEDRAAGHGMRNGMAGRVPEIVHTATYSAGSICSTAGDMVRWLQALHGGKVLTTRSYADLTAPAKLADGTLTRYAMGLVIWSDQRGLRQVGHGGGGFGHSSQAWWHPDSQLATVILTNSEPDNTTAIAEALWVEVLGPAKAAAQFTGNAAELTGTYTAQVRGKAMVIEVSQAPNGLAIAVDGAPARPLEWVDGWTFRLPVPLVTFRRSGNTGAASELRYDTGGDHYVLRRAP